jgi:hypothetical protein
MTKQLKTVVILDQVSGYAQIDIIEALCTKYAKCVLIAGEVKERDKPFPKDKAQWEKIIRYNRNTSYQRILTWLIGSFQMFAKVLVKYRNARIIAVSNPPFSVFIPWLLKCKYDIVIYDIYPDALVNMGYLSSSNWLVKTWVSLNKKIFSSAQRVITLSDGMKAILSNYAAPDKIEVIPIWSFNNNLPPVEKADNIILKKLGVADKFIISYSGNFGVTHPLESLVELAAKLDPEKFHVIIAGDGARKPIIQKAIEKWQPKNLSMLPWQPAEQLHHVLSMGDIGVVVLDDTASNTSVPSKTYDLLSAGTSILGICSKESSLSKILADHRCGVTLRKDNIAGIVELMNEFNSDTSKLKELSNNAKLASKDYTSKNAYLYIPLGSSEE